MKENTIKTLQILTKSSITSLQESEEKYRALFENSIDPIYISTQEGALIDVNQAFLDLFGYGREEMKDLKIQDIYVHEDDRSVFQQKIEQKGFVKDCELKFRKKTGEEIDCLVTSTLRLGDDGHVLGYQGIIRDITDKRRTEQALERSERRLRMIAENVPALFSYIDTDGRYRFVNKRYEEWFGVSREEIIGKVYREVLGETVYEIIRQRIEAALSGNQVTFEDFLPYDNGNDRWVRAEYVPDFDDQGNVQGIFALVYDISDYKQSEEALRNSREQLRNLSAYLQSSREQERASIAREVHDDLGQTLTALKMDLNWVEKRLTADQQPLIEKHASMEQLVDIAIESVEKIITTLRPVILDDLGLFSAIEWLTEDFKKRTEIDCKVQIYPDDLILNQESSINLFRIIQETLTNVVRHAEATKVEIVLVEKSGDLTLTIEDNGIGITEAQVSHPKSFGLMGIRERVHVLGGKVNLKGIRNKGTALTVTIPIREP